MPQTKDKNRSINIDPNNKLVRSRVIMSNDIFLLAKLVDESTGMTSVK